MSSILKVDTIQNTAGNNLITTDNNTTSLKNPNGTTGLTIDSSGRVSNPNLISFEAIRTLGNVAVNNVVVFNQTRHNTGGHYNTSNGTFTAPIAGSYIFTCHGFTNNTADLTMDMQVNQANVLRMQFDTNAGYRGQVLSAIFKLAVNDTVRMYTTSGEVHYNTSGLYSNFTGAFLG